MASEQPANSRHLFESHSLIRQSENLDVVECDACGDGHVEEVEILTEPAGTKPRAYISCPEAGRVFVEWERLQQWSVDLEALARTVAAALDLRDRIVSITPSRVWLLGTRKFVERMQDVFLVRGIDWPDNRQIMESATRLANSPCPLILCLNRIPDDPEWQDHNRIVLSLSETSWLGDRQSTLLEKVSAVLREYPAPWGSDRLSPTPGSQVPIPKPNGAEPAQPGATDGESVQKSVPGRSKDILALFVGSTPDVNKRRSIVFQNMEMSTADLCRRFDFDQIPTPWDDGTTWIEAYNGERRATIDSIVSKHRAEFRKSSS